MLMSQINLAKNITRLRHDRNITQEQLADFIGVTKASVSKWENSQSMPDIMLLPQLAAFFDTTIDELIGYEPQLSREQIQKIYQQLALDFATISFEEAMNKCNELVRRYYSCYPFLLQICILWLNHFMLAEDVVRQQEILQDIANLCQHIMENCKLAEVCNDAMTMKAVVDLQMGKADKVIDLLEDMMDPKRLSRQNDMVLIQAYQAAGQTEKARNYTQITMYLYLIAMIGGAVWYLDINMEDMHTCQETMRRVNILLDAYDVDNLHPNSAAQFHYQCALVYMRHHMQKDAMKELKHYAKNVRFLLKDNHIQLHGDNYFDSLEEWFEHLDLGTLPPRNTKMVVESFRQSLEHPLLSPLKEREEYIRIKESIDKI